MQQWARRYLQLAQAQTTLHKRARTREYLYEGVQAFGLSQAVEAVPVLLHVAVFLFFAGVVDFLFSIDSIVGRVIFSVMCFFGGIYVLLTFLSRTSGPTARTGLRSATTRSSGSSLSRLCPLLSGIIAMDEVRHKCDHNRKTSKGRH